MGGWVGGLGEWMEVVPLPLTTDCISKGHRDCSTESDQQVLMFVEFQ